MLHNTEARVWRYLVTYSTCMLHLRQPIPRKKAHKLQLVGVFLALVSYTYNWLLFICLQLIYIEYRCVSGYLKAPNFTPIFCASIFLWTHMEGAISSSRQREFSNLCEALDVFLMKILSMCLYVHMVMLD